MTATPKMKKAAIRQGISLPSPANNANKKTGTNTSRKVVNRFATLTSGAAGAVIVGPGKLPGQLRSALARAKNIGCLVIDPKPILCGCEPCDRFLVAGGLIAGRPRP